MNKTSVILRENAKSQYNQEKKAADISRQWRHFKTSFSQTLSLKFIQLLAFMNTIGNAVYFGLFYKAHRIVGSSVFSH